MKFFVIILSILVLSSLSTPGFAYHASLSEHARIFDLFTTEKSVYEIPKDNKTVVKIYGKLIDQTFHDKHSITLTITYPDETKKKMIAPLNSIGEFKTNFWIDKNSQIGEYKIIASYDKHNSIEIFFTVSPIGEPTKSDSPSSSATTDEPDIKDNSEEIIKNNTQVQSNLIVIIPLWVQDLSKMLYDKQISETEFTQSLKYLITNNIIQITKDKTQEKIQDKEIQEWIKKVYILLPINNANLNDKPELSEPSLVDKNVIEISTFPIIPEINGRVVEVLSISDVNYLRSLERINFTIFPEGGTWYKYENSSLTPLLIQRTVPIFHENELGNILPYEIIVMIG